jgi:acyl carrier protein
MSVTQEELDFWSFFSEVLETEGEFEYDFNTSLEDVSEWDSLVLLSFMALASQQYSIQIDGGQMKDANTIGDLYRLLHN